MRSLVSTDWLEKNLRNVRIVDGTWHLPNIKLNAFDEFKKSHITNANFFDIDKNSNQNSNLPHMLPKKEEWEKYSLEIENRSLLLNMYRTLLRP